MQPTLLTSSRKGEDILTDAIEPESRSTARENEVGVRCIRLDDLLDKPLYRIFPLWSFEDMLRVRRLVLVPPSFWEDPLEDIPSSIMMEGPNHQQKHLAEYLHPAFCQCWSFESESDSLLRAYSRVTIDKLHKRNVEPQYEGVQVRTTPRRLAQALIPWATRSHGGQLYLGRVDYADTERATSIITNTLARVGPYEMARGENRAQSLLLKRTAFSHEDEARLIWVGSDRRHMDSPMTANVDPNDFIDEVRFDPRLVSFERIEREDRAKTLGYKGKFSDSLLYQRIFLQTILPWNWDEWENGGQPNPPKPPTQ